jgi:hypothetical protein
MEVIVQITVALKGTYATKLKIISKTLAILFNNVHKMTIATMDVTKAGEIIFVPVE